jgi:predicted short-subunit dehydrogenase-like oxidoreductase (DUF2520 family)
MFPTPNGGFQRTSLVRRELGEAVQQRAQAAVVRLVRRGDEVVRHDHLCERE